MSLHQKMETDSIKNVYVEFNFILQPWIMVCFQRSFNCASQYWINLDVRNEIKTWFFLGLSILNQAFLLNYALYFCIQPRLNFDS